MPVKKTTKKSAKKMSVKDEQIVAAAGLLFAGCVTALSGYLQPNDNIKLLLLGFAAAFGVFGAVLLGMSTGSKK